MRSKEEIENKFTQIGLAEVKNRDNYWYKIGYSQALLYCLGKEVEDYLFDYSDDDFEKIKELKEENKRLFEEIKSLQYNMAVCSTNDIDNAVTLFAKDKAILEQKCALLEAYKNTYYHQTLDDEIKINELYQVLEEIKDKCTWSLECGVTNDNTWEYYEIIDIITKTLGNEVQNDN